MFEYSCCLREGGMGVPNQSVQINNWIVKISRVNVWGTRNIGLNNICQRNSFLSTHLILTLLNKLWIKNCCNYFCLSVFFFLKLYIPFDFLVLVAVSFNINSNMDSSFGQPLYHPRSQRTFDGASIATTTLGVALKQVDMSCPFHPEEQSSNYCIESKCYQPLCS